MAKLLNRIFSFSKKSRPQHDPDFNPSLQGENDAAGSFVDPAGSIRTTGGIGGLGRGITNTASQLQPTSYPKGSKGKLGKGGSILGSYTKRIGRVPRSTSGPVTNDPALVISQDEDTQQDTKEKGMRKRRLRRASLSASNLLSWGQPQVEQDITALTRGNASSSLANRKEKDESRLRPSSAYDKAGDKDPFRHEAKHSDFNPEHAPQNIDDMNIIRRKQESEEQLTRLLRNSSTNYRIISETDYKAFGPIGTGSPTDI